MSYVARTFNVMIASPGDVASERSIVRDVVYEWTTSVRYIGGTDIQTNGKNVIPSKERREIAKWEQALQELVDLELVVGRGHQGQIFELSNLGYQIADMIAL